MTFVNTGKISFTGITDALEHATNGLHQKLVDAGWAIHNTIVSTPGAKDIIFKSAGEDGTEVMYIRITQSGQNALFRMGTWYVASGTPADNVENQVGATNYTHVQMVAASCNGWVIGDANGIVWILEQGGYYSTFFFGMGARVERTTISGRTKMNEGGGKTIAGAGNTTFNVDSSANMTVGQKLFIINQATPSYLLRCTLQNIDSPTQITVSNDVGTSTTFADDALVGLDPMPMMMGVGRYFTTGGAKYMGEPAQGFYTLYNPSVTRFTGTSQSYNIALKVAWTTTTVSAYTYGGSTGAFTLADPDVYGQRPIFPCFVVGHFPYNSEYPTAATDQLRGRVDRICRIPFVSGSIAPEDTLTDNDGTTYILIPDEDNRTNVDMGYNAIRMVA